MNLLILLMLLFSFPIFGRENICSFIPDQKQLSIPLSKNPNYFFRMSPNGENLFYISDMKNWLLHIPSMTETSLPGQADPVPSPDGTVLTYIKRLNSFTWELNVQAMIPAWMPNSSISQVLTAVGGSYQSVSSKQEDGSRRILFMNDASRMIEISSLFETGQSFNLKKNNAILNYESEYRLPIMSPDGRRLSILNIDKNKTEIFDLVEKNGEISPVLIDTLPIGAGKATFSYDGNKIAFHLTREFQKQPSAEINYPIVLGGKESLRNIYTYDLLTKKITQITDNIDVDSYYPVFLENGNIAYIDRTSNDKYSLTISRGHDQQESRSLKDVVDCLGANAESDLKRLGDVWGLVCKRWLVSNQNDSGISLSAALNMPVKVCRKLSKDHEDLNLSRVCDAFEGKKAAPNNEQPDQFTKPAPKITDGEIIFQNRCAMCHEGNQTKIFNSDSFEERIKGKKSNRMPPMGETLSWRQRSFLKSYAKEFKKR